MLIVLIIFAVVSVWVNFGYGQSASLEVTKRIIQWLGEEPTSKRRIVWGWLEVDVYNTPNAQVVVDPKSKEILMVSLRLKHSRILKDIGIDEALRHGLQWMERGGIGVHGWTLEEKHRYDRGSGGIEYMFTWFKYSPEGVQLPAFMRLLVSGEGDVIYWSRIDMPVNIPLIPKISAEEALLKAQLKVREIPHLIGAPRLRVWFGEGEQRLCWEIVFYSKDSGRSWDIVVIIDAHTGELIETILPLGEDWMEREKRRYLLNASKIAKELEKCMKIEIFHKDVLDKPVAILNHSDKRFQQLLFAIRKLLRDGEGIIGAPPYGLLAEFQIRFYISSNIAYEAKLSLRAAYFEILGKFQLKKDGKGVWQRLEAMSVVVHKCPKEFVQRILQVMRQIPGIPVGDK